MTHELLLTSVARGQEPGEHDFCPVAIDSEISPRVVAHLYELNSFWHHVPAPGKQMPVAYSHLLLPGRIEHVLTRISNNGVNDQSHPNMLIHHVVLEGQECCSEGPAWLLALPGFHCSEWNMPPVQFLCGRPVPTLTIPPSLTRRQHIARQHRWLDPHKISLTGFVDTNTAAYHAAVQENDEQIALAVPPSTPCPRWKELTGDPGWGGMLADTVFSEQPVVLIYKPEHNILPLFIEALALLPPHASWLATFCTHFVGLPDTIPCQWTGVHAGTDEANRLVKDRNNLIFDLSVPLRGAPTGKYVEYARHGQEQMLPLDTEEYAAVLANADTKWFAEASSQAADTTNVPPPVQASPLPLPTIQFPPKQAGLLDLFLHRSSRFQFYFLYSVIFILVLILLVLTVDQVGNLGIVHALRNWNQPVPFVPHNVMQPEDQSALDTKIEQTDSEPVAQAKQENSSPIPNVTHEKVFEENKEQQKEPLLQLLERFDVPQYLGMNFPEVQNDQINLPESRTFDELRPLHPLGAALELRFIPLFELPEMRVETRFMVDQLPDLVWQTEVFDTTDTAASPANGVPMFRFHLTAAGLVMDWQPEGLNNQFLYYTVLFSLGFVEFNVAGVPESVKQIPLFEPVKAEPVKISALAELPELPTPEFIVELPFASELWQRVFAELDAELKLPKQILLEDWAPEEYLRQSKRSICNINIPTAQQVGIPTENRETLFENIEIEFSAEALFEKVVWTERTYMDWTGRLRLATSEKEKMENKCRELDIKVFEGDEKARQERDSYRDKLRDCDSEIKKAENIINKLPSAYEELKHNESARIRFSVFLATGDGKRKLRILTTE